MDKWRRITLITILFFTVFTSIFFFPYLGEKEFQGEEGRRVLVAITMIETGDLLLPKLLTEPYFNKPPLYNWVIALFFKITNNFSELTARATSTFSILITALFLTFLWRKMILAPDENKSNLQFTLYLLPGLIFLTTPDVIDKALRSEIDAFYTMLITFGLFLWFYFYEVKSKKYIAFFFLGIFLGLGILTKTFQALIFFYLAFIPYLLWQKRIREFFSLPHLLGIFTMMFVFLLWAIPVSLKNGVMPFLQAWMAEYKSAAIAGEMQVLQHFESYTLYFLTDYSPWLLFLLFYRGKSLRHFLKSRPLLWKLCLFSTFAFALTYIFHLFFLGSRLRYILPSVGGFVILVSLVFYYLHQVGLPKPNLFRTSVLVFSLANLLIGFLFLLYLLNKKFPVPTLFYLVHLVFILLNLFIFLKFEATVKSLIWYLVLYIFLLKHLYVFFYYPLHITKMNYHRKAAIEIGNMLREKDKNELYFCRTIPHNLTYYLKYRYNLVDTLIYIDNCQKLPSKSFILVMQKDYDLNWDRSVKAIPLKVREKRYYLLYKE
ncbi:MAG: ArnT family glycosyltransferase [Caldimicrobium sp.]